MPPTPDMISGLNQEVDIVGRTFHFQTELSRSDALLIRTEVFVGGKVVATRETLLDREEPAQLDEDALRAAMKAQHQRVIQSTVERVTTYQERKREPAEPEAAGLGLPAFDTGEVSTLVPPTDEMKKKVGTAIRIRRVFGKFRLRLGLGEEVPGVDIVARLEMAARGFRWIMSSPTFQEIRVDEQMRCNLVNDQVNGWLQGARDRAEAAAIWSEIVAFNVYVAEINNRAELVRFDRQLLTWAAYKVKRGGMRDEVMDHLQWLFGRATELDTLLDQPAGVTDETWFTRLCEVMTHIHPS